MEKQSKFITDKRSIGEKFGNKDLNSTKLKAVNNKYDNIKSTVNTGKTIKNVVLESDKLVSKKRSELFARVKPDTIVKLMNEVKINESIYSLAEESKESNIQKGENVSVTAVTNSTQVFGDLSKITKHILIDLRDSDEYDNYHIKDSVNMPFYNISRDKFPQDMYMMKNKSDKMIICYALDERNSITHCQLLFQKGFDNIYMLTGGIEEFVIKYPDYCEGKEMPNIIMEQKKKEEKEKLSQNKTRYKTTSVIGSVKNDPNVSCKQSVVSGVSNFTQKSSISTLKKNLGVMK